jgi:hypothetical protein
MKKIAFALLTLLLTATFLYNVIGYQLMFSLKKEQKWVAEMQKIPDSKFKVLRLNATLYSFIDDTEMEIVNENFTYKNKTYHVFKKQIKGNIISLYYLPNDHFNSEVSIKNLVENDLFENAPLSKKPLEKIVKSFVKDYLPNHDIHLGAFNNSIYSDEKDDFHPKEKLQSGYLIKLFSPPKSEFSSIS